MPWPLLHLLRVLASDATALYAGSTPVALPQLKLGAAVGGVGPIGFAATLMALDLIILHAGRAGCRCLSRVATIASASIVYGVRHPFALGGGSFVFCLFLLHCFITRSAAHCFIAIIAIICCNVIGTPHYACRARD